MKWSNKLALLIALATFVAAELVSVTSTQAATGRYLILGTGTGPASAGRLVELDAAGTTAVSNVALPDGPTNSTFPVYNPTSGYVMYGGSRPGTVGVFDLESFIDGGAPPVSTYSYSNGGIHDSEWEADPLSGKFLSAVRFAPTVVTTFDPTTGVFTNGATHGMGIPEATWIYNGFVYSAEESNNRVWRVPLGAGGTTVGAMVNQFDLAANGIPNSQGGFSEFFSITTFSDGISLAGTHSTNLYLFDLDTQPNAGAGVTTIDLLSHLTTSNAGGFNATGGFVTGIEHDESNGLFYVLGTLTGTGLGGPGQDFVVAVDKIGNVSVIIEEAAGDTVIPTVGANSYGLGVANFGAVPEPSSFVLAGLGLLGLVGYGLQRRGQK